MNKTVSALVCTLALLSTHIHAADRINISASQRDVLGIKTAPLQAVAEYIGYQAPAHVVIPPSQVHIVSTSQAGLINEVNVAVGDSVTKGAVLAEIQSPDLVTLQRDYLQTLSQEQLLKTKMERDQTLFKEGIIAQRRYLETKSLYLEASAALDERKQTLELAGMNSTSITKLRKTRKLTSTLSVNARWEGVVLERMVVTGTRVEANAPLFRIANLSQLWLDMRVPISAAQSLKPGSLITVTDIPVKAKLIMIGHEVSPGNQTVLVRGEVTQGIEHIRPGQYLEAQLSTQDDSAQYRIPAEALVRSGSQTLVFVEVDQGFRALPVRLLSQQDQYAIIAGNLTGNERIAVTGIAAIKGAWQGLGGAE